MNTVAAFKAVLKTHLFHEAFGAYFNGNSLGLMTKTLYLFNLFTSFNSS